MSRCRHSSGAHAFLHMSRDEPSALVYLEAASTGLPLVVHDSPVVRWTLGDAALYVNTSDTTAVAATVRQGLDPAVAQVIGRKARDQVSAGWSWDILAAKYRAFFRELLADSLLPSPLGGEGLGVRGKA